MSDAPPAPAATGPVDQGKVTPTTRFVSVSLKEPNKETVHRFTGVAPTGSAPTTGPESSPTASPSAKPLWPPSGVRQGWLN